MNKSRIDDIFERVRLWPPERQEDAARILAAMDAADTEPYRLSDEERADLEEALKEADQRDFASAEAVKAVLSSHRS